MAAQTGIEGGLAALLAHGIEAIASEQLPSGEIVNYRQLGQGWTEYCFSPLPAAYVHGALALFDPLSAEFDLQVLESAGQAARMLVSRAALEIRRKIRRFLAWQEGTDGTWRFFGNTSALPADLDTTACASLALSDGLSLRRSPGLQTNANQFRVFPLADRLFSSAGSRLAEGEVDPWLALAANANCISCLAIAGAEYRGLAAALTEKAHAVDGSQSGRLVFDFALAKAWRRTRAPELENLVSEESQREAGEDRCAGLLASALRLTACLDFGLEGLPVMRAAEELRGSIESQPNWPGEAFADPWCGSPALTAAISISALARATAAVSEEPVAAGA